ncbi:MAG: HDIG domain-containing protein [bacterium]|nr:HDIG domain-containing protein [bacterium]
MKNLKIRRLSRKKREKKVKLPFLIFSLLLSLTLVSLVNLGIKCGIFETDVKFPVIQKRVEISTFPYFSRVEVDFDALRQLSDSLGPEFLPLFDFVEFLLSKPVVKDELLARMDTIYFKKNGTLRRLTGDSLLSVSELRDQVKNFLNELNLEEAKKEEVFKLVEPFLRPNIEIAGAIKDTTLRIERIDPTMDARSKRFELAFFVLYLIFAFTFGYFWAVQSLSFKNDSRVTIVFLFAYLMLIAFPHFGHFFHKPHLFFIFPASLMLVAFFGGFLNAFALFLGSLLIFFPYFKPNFYESFFVNSVFGVFSILAGEHIKRRWDYFITLIGFIVLTFLVSLAARKVWGGSFSNYFIDFAVLSVISVLLVILLILVFERILRYPTDFVLLELSNVNHPLLVSLQEEAPGTFEHSLRVSEMGARIAPIIGISPLLARVAGLYHDIGKKLHSVFFIENQISGENPHDMLSPEMSVQILKSHVLDGVNLAKSYRLPDEVIGVIETHHGTSVMYSFYKKALRLYGEVDANKFRYPGPKPRNKLEALFMILDGIEASSRALEEKNEKRFRDLIEEIVEEKVKDGERRRITTSEPFMVSFPSLYMKKTL